MLSETSLQHDIPSQPNNAIFKWTPDNIFIWKIPLFTSQNLDLLVIGYIRQQSTLLLTIPTDIIDLFTHYFNDSLDIKQIKDAKNSESFKSGIFSVNDRFKFEMEICPNGEDQQNIGQFAVFLNLASIPSITNKIDMKYIFELCELNQIYADDSTYSRNPYESSYRWAVSLDKIKTLDTLTLKIDIKGLRIYCTFKDEELIQTVNKIYVNNNLYLPIGRYVWNISDLSRIKRLEIGDNVVSDIFEIESFKWMIKIGTGNGFAVAIGVDLLSWSPNVSSICVRYNIECIELNIVENQYREFKAGGFTFWFDKLKNINPINLKHMTIKFELMILDVFDNNGIQINSYKQWHNNGIIMKKNKFIWNISNKQQVMNIKYSKQMGNKFISKCFEVIDSKWCLRFYPLWGNDNNGYPIVALMLNLISLHPLIYSICVNFELIFKEGNISKTQNQQFYRNHPCNREQYWGWQQTNIYLKHMEEFTFECIMNVIDVYNKYGESIMHKYVNLNQEENDKIFVFDDDVELVSGIEGTIMKYIWYIDNNDMKYCYRSDLFMSKIFKMHGLKWVLEFFPYEINRETNEEISILSVSLASKPPHISSIVMELTLKLEEINIIYNHFVELCDNNMCNGCNNYFIFKRYDIIDLETFTFEIDLNLIDIYDINGNQIIIEDDDYINNQQHEDSKSQSIRYNDDEQIIEQQKEIEIAKEIKLQMDNYQWIINQNTMEIIKQCNYCTFFESPWFKINGLKFLMQIAPNGENINSKGQFEWFLYLVSIPINIYKVSIYYKVTFIDINIIDIYKTEFSLNKSYHKWRLNRAKFDDMFDLQSMSINIEIGIIDVFDKHGNIVDNYKDKYGGNYYDDDQKINPHSMTLQTFDKYTWSINNMTCMQNIQIGHCLNSEIFGDSCKDIQWNIKLWPNGMDNNTKYQTILGLYLLSMPKDSVAMSVYFEIRLIEINIVWRGFAHFRKNKLSELCDIKKLNIKIKDIIQYKKLTMKIKISMIDVYDDESNVITDKWLD